jgi:hypothetical protein
MEELFSRAWIVGTACQKFSNMIISTSYHFDTVACQLNVNIEKLADHN